MSLLCQVITGLKNQNRALIAVWTLLFAGCVSEFPLALTQSDGSVSTPPVQTMPGTADGQPAGTGLPSSPPSMPMVDTQPKPRPSPPIQQAPDAGIMLDAGPAEGPRQDMGLGESPLSEDMMVEAPNRCRFIWPEVCSIDCNHEPPAERLLHVRAGQTLTYRKPIQDYMCVLIEGTVQINQFETINADIFVLGPTGLIDGLGRNNASDASVRGRNGQQTQRVGSGGGGGGGACNGGDGGDAQDVSGGSGGPESEISGIPGGRGGDGSGVDQGQGKGGAGGASLRLNGRYCRFAGTVDLSGKPGSSPVGPTGGGGGGAAGQLIVDCQTTHFDTPNLAFKLIGGQGAHGGEAQRRWDHDGQGDRGGGGGGGSGGRLHVLSEAIFIDSMARDMNDDIQRQLRALSSTQGGSGGGQGQSDGDRRGRPGEDCEISVEFRE